MYEPAFDSADATRSLRSRKLLDRITQENTTSEKRLSQTQERIISLQEEIDTLTNSLREYKESLDHKNQALEYARHEIDDVSRRIASNEEKINGLCIRTLTKADTSLILKYLAGNGNTSSVKTVCKYWNLLCKSEEDQHGDSNTTTTTNKHNNNENTENH